MLTKDLILETIKNMPEEEFDDIDVLLERLVILDKIQTGIEQADRGELIPLEEDIKEIKQYIFLDSPLQAERVTEKIAIQIQKLSEYPQLGRPVILTKRVTIRQILVFKYRIFYR